MKFTFHESVLLTRFSKSKSAHLHSNKHQELQSKSIAKSKVNDSSRWDFIPKPRWRQLGFVTKKNIKFGFTPVSKNKTTCKRNLFKNKNNSKRISFKMVLKSINWFIRLYNWLNFDNLSLFDCFYNIWLNVINFFTDILPY